MKLVTVYQGLFLIAFALYASERNRIHRVLSVPSSPEHQELTEIQSPELRSLYQKLKVAPVFSTTIDGVSLSHSLEEIKIQLKSEELYQGDETAIEETWLPVLDQIGNVLFAGSSDAPKFGIVFSSNAPFEKDAFSFSSQRAEWVLRYFNRKFPLRLDQGTYRVTGMGKTTDSKGKTIPTVEITIFSSNF
jgi:hypothetical protein